MSEEKLTYKELVRLLIDRIESIDKKFDNLDTRETIIQKALARLEGKIEGTKEAEEKADKQWKWKVATVISIVGLVVSIIVAVVSNL